MPQSGYLSLDPQAGQPVAATPPPAGPYLSTDPRAGQPGGGRGGGPGVPAPAHGGRGGGPGDVRAAAAAPPPDTTFYPGGWKGFAEDAAGIAGGIGATAAATALLPEELPVAGVAGIAKALPYAARVARGVIGIAGAGAGGATAAAASGSPLTAQAPPSGEDPDSVVAAFKRQAEMEALGLGTGWVASALGRRAIGRTVARNAIEGLASQREATLARTQAVLDQARDALQSHAAATAQESAARTAAIGAKQAEAQTAQIQAMGAERQAKVVKEIGAERATQARAQWPQSEAELQEHMAPGSAAQPPPNFPAQAAGKVAEVVQGPAKSSKALLGEAVDAAAQSGPEIDITGVKRAVEAMHAKTRPERLVAEAVPPKTEQELIREFVAGQRENVTGARAGTAAAGGVKPAATDWRSLLGVDESHPLPGVLSEIQNAPDQVPFAVAHQIKRNLNDAVNWAAPAKKQLQQITKGASQQIRGALRDAGHAPYEQATAAYGEVAKLFDRNQLGAQITRLVETGHADRVVSSSLIKPSEPIPLRMLKEVLLHHGEQGGGAEGRAAGQAAWDSLRSSVMYKYLIQPGLENFDKSVAKMHPEFLHLLTEDGPGRDVFERLATMADAVKDVEARTAEQVTAVTAAGQEARTAQRAASSQAAVLKQQGTQVAAQRAVERTALRGDAAQAARGVREARKPTPAEKALDRSTLVQAQAPRQIAAEGAYAALAPLGSPRQVAGFSRLVLGGPKVNDLIRWASLSPTATRAFVRAVTSPAPGQAVAALIRLKDWMGGETPPAMAVGHQQGAGAPARQPAAVPPPGPGR